jgi:hypothetical protein
MRATTLIPPSPSPSPALARAAAGDVRFVAVRANLMPDEVIWARRTEVVRRRVLIGLGVLLVLLLGGFATAWLQTLAAKGDLSDQHHRTTALQSQQHDYAPLVAAQASTANINGKLQLLMVGDVRWQPMFATIRGDAPAGLGITSISAQITTQAAGGVPNGAPPILGQPAGVTPIGALTIVGTATNKDQVAAYAEKLGTETGVVNADVTNWNGSARPYTFTIVGVLTADALGGPYHQPAPSAAAPTTTQEGK